MITKRSTHAVAIDGINNAMRLEISTGNALPIVTLVSEEFGPLVVMKATDIAVVLAYVNRRVPLTASES